MKLTALVPDDLIAEVKNLSSGKNITDSVIIALKEWVAWKRVNELNQQLKAAPLKFRAGFSANSVRKQNRNR